MRNSRPDTPQSLLAVTDDPLLIQLLAAYCTGSGIILLQSADARQVCSTLRSMRPDLIVVDEARIFANDTVLASQLRAEAQAHQSQIVWLTCPNPAPHAAIPREIRIPRPYSTQMLFDAIANALRSRGTDNPGWLAHAGLWINHDTRRAGFHDREIFLQPRQFELLAFLMRHVDRVFGRQALLDALWGNTRFVQERSVDVLVLRLRSTLAKHDLGACIETVRGAGYRFRPPSNIAGTTRLENILPLPTRHSSAPRASMPPSTPTHVSRRNS